MKKYETYLPSGIEWLDEIPEKWKKSKLKYLGNLYGGLTGKSGVDFNNDENPKNKPYIPYTNIFNNTYISKDHYHYVSIDESENQNRVKKYDLFFLMSSETHKDLGKSCILIDDVEELYLNSFCKGYRINNVNINPLFLNYQILGHFHREMISVEGKGFTRINLRQDKINDLVVFYPPLKEQEQIVKYLDEKTSIIDKLISTKQRKIELLKEKRTTLINQFITKGLDPNVKMKDSGVEWIGEIPEHWKMKKLKYIFQIRKRISGELGYDVLSITQKGVRIKDIESGKGQVSLDYTKYQIVEVGDFTMNHMDLLTGFIDISPFKGVTSPDYRVFTKTDEKSNSRYYLSLFQFGYINKVFYGFGQGSSMLGRWRLPSNEFNNFKLPYPSLEEQNRIVESLDKHIQEIDGLVQLEQNKIELLKEYRQSLISEVITGKIKVVE
jgi:type I restriction enzyme S subunit